MKFSIRDVLWLTLVVATVLASGIGYMNARTENRRLRTIIDFQEVTIEHLTKSVQQRLSERD